jgi:hypothetical protein
VGSVTGDGGTVSAGAVIPAGLEPLGVWESDGPDFWADGAPRLPRVAWLNARARISTDRLYRIEFYQCDGPFAVAYRVAVTEDGRACIDEDGRTVTEPPAVVPLAELPPAHLLRGCPPWAT